MYFIDPKLENYALAALKTIQKKKKYSNDVNNKPEQLQKQQ